MRIALVALCSTILLPPLAHAQEKVVRFDPAQTLVSFTLSDVLHTVHGTFRLRSGQIRFDQTTGKASGQMVVDAASGDSGSHARDSRMHKNILESSKYPDITFTPGRVDGRVNSAGDSHVQVQGSFSIHGSAHEMTLPADVHCAGQLTADIRFHVPYVKWGMKNPSTLFLRVSDEVQIEIKAVGTISQ